MAQIERPLSPHLQVYRPQITSVLSILHRLTGIALGLGALLLSAWVIAAATSAEAYDQVQSLIGSFIGQIILFGFAWAFFYHLANGLRHLAWDIGYGYEMPTVRKTGWAVVIFSFAATLIVWVLAYGAGR